MLLLDYFPLNSYFAQFTSSLLFIIYFWFPSYFLVSSSTNSRNKISLRELPSALQFRRLHLLYLDERYAGETSQFVDFQCETLFFGFS
uniref:Uncharacterized protein n=1 Tax=Caenorhabditis tropicalis TaxID=1561998 RepID=A0A1I7U535_9PELO